MHHNHGLTDSAKMSNNITISTSLH